MNRKSWEWWAGVARVDCIFGIRNACFCIWDATETMAGDKAPTTKKKHDDDGRSKMVYHK